MNYLNNKPIIIGIDHGYGNIKTAHTCFPTGVTAHDKEPTFKNDLLIYEGGYYTIGEGHKEFAAEKNDGRRLLSPNSRRHRAGAAHPPCHLRPRAYCGGTAPHMGQ